MSNTTGYKVPVCNCIPDAYSAYNHRKFCPRYESNMVKEIQRLQAELKIQDDANEILTRQIAELQSTKASAFIVTQGDLPPNPSIGDTVTFKANQTRTGAGE